MYSVHVVTADDITHYPADKLTAFRQSRVEKDLFIIGDKPFGMLMIDVGIGETGVSRRARPVRIQPSVKLHVPFMAFLDQEGHRVELTCRGYALLSGEEAAPRLDIGFIESVRLGAHLKDDGVDAACLQVIKLADEVFFHPGGSHILVFALKSGLYPCSPKLSLGLLARTRSRTRLLANRRTCGYRSKENRYSEAKIFNLHGCLAVFVYEIFNKCRRFPVNMKYFTLVILFTWQ